MAKFIPVTKTVHAESGWQVSPNYRFTSSIEMVPLLAEEIDKVPELPLAFYPQNDSAGKTVYRLVALLSPLPGRNLLLKADGSWLTGHVPLFFRHYPFRLLPSPKTGEPVVCFDRESGLMTAAGTPGSSPFFAENGEPSPSLQEVIGSLKQYEQRRLVTQIAVDALAEHGLIAPWRLIAKDETGATKEMLKIFKVNGTALSNLTAEPLFALHQCGALPLAYAQLLSERRVQHFGELLPMWEQPKPSPATPAQPANLAPLLGASSDLISFAKL